MRRTHIVSGVLLAALAAGCIFWLIPTHTEAPQSPLDLPPAFMPTLSMSICLVLALVLAVRDALRHRAGEEEPHEEFGEEATGVGARELANVAVWALAAVVTWLIMDRVGFEPAMAVFLVVAMLYTGVRGLWLVGAIALIAPVLLSQLTWYVFTVQLPGFWR